MHTPTISVCRKINEEEEEEEDGNGGAQRERGPRRSRAKLEVDGGIKDKPAVSSTCMAQAGSMLTSLNASLASWGEKKPCRLLMAELETALNLTEHGRVASSV